MTSEGSGEQARTLRYMHKAMEGRCDPGDGYGIRTAEMCGLPWEIVEEARVLRSQVVQAAKSKAVKGKEGATSDGEKDAHELLRTLAMLKGSTMDPFALREFLYVLSLEYRGPKAAGIMAALSSSSSSSSSLPSSLSHLPATAATATAAIVTTATTATTAANACSEALRPAEQETSPAGNTMAVPPPAAPGTAAAVSSPTAPGTATALLTAMEMQGFETPRAAAVAATAEMIQRTPSGDAGVTPMNEMLAAVDNGNTMRVSTPSSGGWVAGDSLAVLETTPIQGRVMEQARSAFRED